MADDRKSSAEDRGLRIGGLRVFNPILPGATARDRAIACLGAVVGIALAGLIGSLVHDQGDALPWIVAPIGASAVLLFVVPASPMAQPWPIFGGNALSALVGFAVGQWLGHGALGGSLVDSAGWWFPLAPVGLNALVLVAVGWLFHRLSGHPYPHPQTLAPATRPSTR